MAIDKKKLAGKRFTIEIEDAGYPDLLRKIENPPKVVYGIGDESALSLQSIAIIGTRKATPYGLACARRFSEIAVDFSACIVTGGAVGIEAAAMRAAIEMGGKAVVVLGSGCDCVYPQRNAKLFQEIIDRGGAIVSELPWSQPPMPHAFRIRARIIAGLAIATLACEAGLPSGTFGTCDFALGAGRDVLVVPGPITSPQSAGCNAMLASGVHPIFDDSSFAARLYEYGFIPSPTFSITTT